MKKCYSWLYSLVFAQLPLATVARAQEAIDLFPLGAGMRFVYSYQWEEHFSSLGYGTRRSHSDSGFVEYVILSSSQPSDSSRIWNVRQSEHLLHHLRETAQYPPAEWDSLYSSDTSFTFTLSEDLRGWHEIQASSRVWAFPIKSDFGTDRVFRYGLMSSYYIYQHTAPPYYPPYWSDYWYFDSPRGLYQRDYSAQSTSNNPYGSTIKVLLISAPNDVPTNSAGLAREGFELLGAYPNPFNASTEVFYRLSEAAEPNLTLYDVLGRSVASYSLGHQVPGMHKISLGGANLASGIYLCALEVHGVTKIHRLICIK